MAACSMHHAAVASICTCPSMPQSTKHSGCKGAAVPHAQLELATVLPFLAGALQGLGEQQRSSAIVRSLRRAGNLNSRADLVRCRQRWASSIGHIPPRSCTCPSSLAEGSAESFPWD